MFVSIESLIQRVANRTASPTFAIAADTKDLNETQSNQEDSNEDSNIQGAVPVSNRDTRRRQFER